MKKWFHVFFKNRWGRGQPDDIGAINLGDEKFDPDSDKKPRAGQILWIRGLTRLQTQVTIPISLFSLSLSIYLSIFLCHSVSLFFILSLSHHSTQDSIFSRFLFYSRKHKWENSTKTAPESNRFRWRDHTSHIRSSLTFFKLSGLFSFLFFSLDAIHLTRNASKRLIDQSEERMLPIDQSKNVFKALIASSGPKPLFLSFNSALKKKFTKS